MVALKIRTGGSKGAGILIQKGQIWCVYDRDSFPAEHFNGVVERAENLNKENAELQYHTAWSNECIEF